MARAAIPAIVYTITDGDPFWTALAFAAAIPGSWWHGAGNIAKTVAPKSIREKIKPDVLPNIRKKVINSVPKGETPGALLGKKREAQERFEKAMGDANRHYVENVGSKIDKVTNSTKSNPKVLGYADMAMTKMRKKLYDRKTAYIKDKRELGEQRRAGSINQAGYKEAKAELDLAYQNDISSIRNNYKDVMSAAGVPEGSQAAVKAMMKEMEGAIESHVRETTEAKVLNALGLTRGELPTELPPLKKEAATARQKIKVAATTNKEISAIKSVISRITGELTPKQREVVEILEKSMPEPARKLLGNEGQLPYNEAIAARNEIIENLSKAMQSNREKIKTQKNEHGRALEVDKYIEGLGPNGEILSKKIDAHARNKQDIPFPHQFGIDQGSWTVTARSVDPATGETVFHRDAKHKYYTAGLTRNAAAKKMDAYLRKKGFEPDGELHYTNKATGEQVLVEKYYQPEASYEIATRRYKAARDLDGLIKQLQRVKTKGKIDAKTNRAVSERLNNMSKEYPEYRDMFKEMSADIAEGISVNEMLPLLKRYKVALNSEPYKAFENIGLSSKPEVRGLEAGVNWYKWGDRGRDYSQRRAGATSLQREMEAGKEAGLKVDNLQEQYWDVLGIKQPHKGYVDLGEVAINWEKGLHNLVTGSLVPVFLGNIKSMTANVLYGSLIAPMNTMAAGMGLKRTIKGTANLFNPADGGAKLFKSELAGTAKNFMERLIRGNAIPTLNADVPKIFKDAAKQKAFSDYARSGKFGDTNLSSADVMVSIQRKNSKNPRVHNGGAILNAAMVLMRATENNIKMRAWETMYDYLRETTTPASKKMTQTQWENWVKQKAEGEATTWSGLYKSWNLGPTMRKMANHPVGKNMLVLLKPAVFQAQRVLNLLTAAAQKSPEIESSAGVLAAFAITSLLLTGTKYSLGGGLMSAIDEVESWFSDEGKILKMARSGKIAKNARVNMRKIAILAGASDKQANKIADEVVSLFSYGAINVLTGKQIGPDVSIGDPQSTIYLLNLPKTISGWKEMITTGELKPDKIRLLSVQGQRVANATASLMAGEKMLPKGNTWVATGRKFGFGDFVAAIGYNDLKDVIASDKGFNNEHDFTSDKGRADFYKWAINQVYGGAAAEALATQITTSAELATKQGDKRAAARSDVSYASATYDIATENMKKYKGQAKDAVDQAVKLFKTYMADDAAPLMAKNKQQFLKMFNSGGNNRITESEINQVFGQWSKQAIAADNFVKQLKEDAYTYYERKALFEALSNDPLVSLDNTVTLADPLQEYEKKTITIGGEEVSPAVVYALQRAITRLRTAAK